MAVVKMNVITVPKERAGELEERFRARAAEVDKQKGFLGFELLRPQDGDRYIVYTKWESEEDFAAWVTSPAFGHGHRAHNEQGPVAAHSELWGYDLVLESKPKG
jgi:heme-degrading monooxygenase HmoA